MRAEIIAIGSELVSGRALDTNSQWLSDQLGRLGIATAFHTTIGDDLADHLTAFALASNRASLVIATGGLGPTQDDLTREALARAAGVPLVEHAPSLEAITAMFQRRGRTMAERNRLQALLPRGAEPLPNPVGTAPGIWMRLGGAWFACLPGVPSEMRYMYHNQLEPKLKELNGGRTFVHRKINLFGRGESDIEAKALDLTERGHVPDVGITASEATISFRISAEGANEDEARALIEPTAALIYERFGDWIIGEEDVDVATALVRRLEEKRATIATAESCTGGQIAQRITTVPGASEAFLGGVVSYANTVKTEMLGVPSGLLDAKGAVCPEVAAAMAEGVRRRLGATIGVSTTGIAGPGGGTPEKPVGLVYLGLATPKETQTRRLDLGPERPREFIQLLATKTALDWARRALAEGL